MLLFVSSALAQDLPPQVDAPLVEPHPCSGLAVWFELFPLDDAQEALSVEQRRDIRARPEVHIAAPRLAEPLVGESGLTACLDVEVWLRSRTEPCDRTEE